MCRITCGTFLGDSGSLSRPLGNAVLDGIDFVIENDDPSFYGDLARNLKSHSGKVSTLGIKVYEDDNNGTQCCEIICRNNCSCDAFAPLNHINNTSTGCQIWLKGTKFVRASGNIALPINVSVALLEHKGTFNLIYFFFFWSPKGTGYGTKNAYFLAPMVINFSLLVRIFINIHQRI